MAKAEGMPAYIHVILTKTAKQYGLHQTDISDNELCPMQFYNNAPCPVIDKKEQDITDRDCKTCWKRKVAPSQGK